MCSEVRLTFRLLEFSEMTKKEKNDSSGILNGVIFIVAVEVFRSILFACGSAEQQVSGGASPWNSF